MFWDLNGATRRLRLLRMRHSAATSVLLPEWEVVPSTTRNWVIRNRKGYLSLFGFWKVLFYSEQSFPIFLYLHAARYYSILQLHFLDNTLIADMSFLE
jgi:hypothetical protein